MIVEFLLLLIKSYQKAISPLLPARCRFYPTCSCYGAQALAWHGVHGLPLVIKRILRCQPWGGSGVDFVPLCLKKYQFTTTKHQSSCVRKDVFGYVARRNHLMKG